MNEFSLECDYGLKEEMLKKVEEDIMDSLISSMFGDIKSAASTRVIANESLTIEKLKELQNQLEPYKKLREDFYKYTIPTYKLKFEDEEAQNNKIHIWNAFNKTN